MEGTVAIALIVAVPTLVVPVMTVYLTGRQRRQERSADYERQDAVAAAAEERELRQEQRQKEVADQAEQAAKLLLASNERVAKQAASSAEVVNGKLAQIHELVNSTLTGAFEDQLLALRQLLEALQDGRTPSADALESARSRITELEAKLADRARQTEIADAQVAPK